MESLGMTVATCSNGKRKRLGLKCSGVLGTKWGSAFCSKASKALQNYPIWSKMHSKRAATQRWLTQSKIFAKRIARVTKTLRVQMGKGSSYTKSVVVFWEQNGIFFSQCIHKFLKSSDACKIRPELSFGCKTPPKAAVARSLNYTVQRNFWKHCTGIKADRCTNGKMTRLSQKYSDVLGNKKGHSQFSKSPCWT